MHVTNSINVSLTSWQDSVLLLSVLLLATDAVNIGPRGVW